MSESIAKQPNAPEDPTAAAELRSKGIRFLDEGNLIAALSCLEKAERASPSAPVRSYLGVCIAAERGQVARGVALCGEAIAAEPDNPVHHLNLARILIRAGRKPEALTALRRGLAAGEQAEIRVLLDKIGTRRPPLFSVLPRSHPLNRILGKILAHLRLR